jgi:Predicted periplasmic lipoprotein (DUF2279)
MAWIRTLVFLLAIPCFAIAQSSPDSSVVRTKSLRIAAITTGVVYVGALAGLNHLWYGESDKQSFRFFNDNAEWKQVDKAGHFYSAFYLSYGFSKGLQHYGVKSSKADLIGTILGFAVLVPIEIFDGYSDAYGASSGDLLADGAGALFYLGQARLWKEVRLKPKFSFHTTKYADLRPELLGEGIEQIIKDYNGQTYWLSVDIDKFISFPRWLNIAFGYGADGMIYARDYQHIPNGLPQPFRQYYIALDPDLSAIRTKSRAIKTLLFLADMIKLPAPTLEFSQSRVKFHGFYF